MLPIISQTNIPYIIAREHLETVRDTALFYPCSGNDLAVPIEIFSPYVTDFWFVDSRYFLDGRSAERQKAVLQRDDRYELVSKEVVGPPSWPATEKDITPCILTETYRHKATDRIIRIHRRRGHGFSALRTEQAIGKLGVFFYRGDSQGEGGSGNCWLDTEHLDDVFAKLICGGLLVLDGSDGSWHKRESGIYQEICKYTHQELSMDPEALIASMKEVTDSANRVYQCIGYAGMRYGPTLIWQGHRP